MPRSGLRSRTRRLVQPSVDHEARDSSESESESSDGDNDIPAIKPPRSSPFEGLAAPPTNLHARSPKRLRLDPSQNGIVLYHGPQNLRNGKPLPNSITSHPRTPIAPTETTSRPESLRASPADSVPDGLLSSVNDVFHRRTPPAIQTEPSASYSLDDTENAEPGVQTQCDVALPSRDDVPEPCPKRKRGRPRKNPPVQTEPSVDETAETETEYEEGLQSDSVSGSDTDIENGNDGIIHDEDDDEAFEGPEEDDDLAIPLYSGPLRELCKLLSLKGWIGTRTPWQWERFECNTVRTEPGRALISVLVKLESLYRATPWAPDFKAQNRYLTEVAGTLRKYFREIKRIVEHIRTRRLAILKPNESLNKIDRCRRKRMTKDLVFCVVPMLVHVLASIWDIGGSDSSGMTGSNIRRDRNWDGGSFTSATVELLTRALGWLMALNHRLRAELERSPLGEKPKTEGQQQVRDLWNARRKELGPRLEKLHEVIAAAPNRLAEAGTHDKEPLWYQERARRLQRQRQIEQQAAEEARRARAQADERKKRSHPPATSSQPLPPPTRKPVKWSVEEQRVLFLRIQASFPLLPDFGDLHGKLNRTVAEIADMTEQILGKMLDIVLVGYSAEERAEEVRKVMRGPQVTG